MRSSAAVLIFWLVVASAQSQDAIPKFTSTSQLVVEVVTVTDKSGKPVEGLTAKDFAITENGVPQAVRLCEFQRLEEGAPASTPVVGERKAEAVTQSQISPEPPGDIRYHDRRLLVIYLDMTAMPQQDQLRALAAAHKFVTTQLTAADMVAVMQFAGGAVKVLQDFTGDRDQLVRVIEKLTAKLAGFEDTANDDSAADTGSAFGQNDAEFNVFSTDRQLSALQTAVNMLRPLKEKKAFVYFASGLRLNGVDNQAQLRATLNAAIRANVAFFPIDARGLIAQAPLGDATKGSPGGVGMYSGASALAAMTNLQRSQDTLYALAADTGGKALLDYNDLSRGIVQAQKAISSYYILGYYSSNTELDGKFRRIHISIKEMQAKLDYRQGYFAGKEFKKFTSGDKERQLEEALMLEDPITDLTISMEVNYFQLNRAEYYVPVILKIPGSELVLARRRGAERTVIDFFGEIKDEYNSTVQNIRDKITIKVSGETVAELAKRHIQYDTGYTLLPGTYTIKVLARDNETGRIGTYQNKFIIPNLNKEEKRVAISSVVLSSQRVDLRDALYTAGKDKEQLANPLVQNGQKLIPSVTRVFSAAREMYVYLQAYNQNAASVQPLIAFATFYRGQAKVFETSSAFATEGLNNRLRTMPINLSIKLNKLPVGKYDFQVTLIDPVSRKAAFWSAPVMVVP